MGKKRDAAYYRGRLRREDPAIYADLMAGRIPSVRRAAAKAGLIHLPTRLDALKREWAGATAIERAAFEAWASSEEAPLPSSTTAARGPLTGRDGHLTLTTISQIEGIIARRALMMGNVKIEMGLSRYDPRLNQALKRSEPPAKEVLNAMEMWLRKWS